MTMLFPAVTAFIVSKRKKSPGRAFAESTSSNICTATTVHGSSVVPARAEGRNAAIDAKQRQANNATDLKILTLLLYPATAPSEPLLVSGGYGLGSSRSSSCA